MTIQQAAQRLGELISALGPDDEIILTLNDHPVARIVANRPHGKRKRGTCKGMLVIHEEDDEHLKDFHDYMP
ncbi:MAG TPA: hypothetical protein VFC78_06940 [Tepidisphaeraceae bacterium]|nr:hypothetical protein [Tepidisphaeraceae bacterium]